jgi:hypothetical protein
MPSNRQKTLGFVKRFGKFMRIRGKGLIHPDSSLDQRFKKMTLMGTGTPAHKQIDGGTIKNHNRPYEFKDSATITPKPIRAFAPIHFKL